MLPYKKDASIWPYNKNTILSIKLPFTLKMFILLLYKLIEVLYKCYWAVCL